MKPTYRRKSLLSVPIVNGFTLVEVLIVLVILGVLAAIVIVKFVGAFAESRENAIQMTLYRVRSQLEIYREQHNSKYPSLANFADQMTMATDVNGNTALPQTPGFPFGPYFAQMPINPNTGTSTISNGAVGASDWYFNETTGAFHANDSAVTFAF